MSMSSKVGDGGKMGKNQRGPVRDESSHYAVGVCVSGVANHESKQVKEDSRQRQVLRSPSREVPLACLCEDVSFGLWVWIIYIGVEESCRFGCRQFLETM